MTSNFFKITISLALIVIAITTNNVVLSQQSIARKWNDLTLEAIRNDFARPTVHSRNLFHISLGMYDAWAAYDTIAEPFLLGKTVGGFSCTFSGITTPIDIETAREEAISYATYRLLNYRFQTSPGAGDLLPLFDDLMTTLGYDISYNSVDYTNGTPADLGNYIAQSIIDFGLQDGSQEQNYYLNQFYSPVNPPLDLTLPGNPDIIDPNRWQPLTLDTYIDQSGNLIPISTPDFLGPEWGAVVPFSLNDSIKNIYSRDGNDYVVYHDPDLPPLLDTINPESLIEEYQWGFSLVSIWSSHLDSANGVAWDISPASIGNVQNYPSTVADIRNFYNQIEGGDTGLGHSINPATGLPYEPQIVPRADYARVLAEFWADGPDSETPPGHWFTLLNYVNDHPDFEKKWRGEGELLDDLEWDVKAYFTMGGTVHDAAITAWGIKGWYDYLRPISAIRHMADNGQSSDPNLSNYSKIGIPLLPGYIEIVIADDTLAGFNATDTGKIKVLAWRGPDYIADPEIDAAGVDWILAENWFPYQRPSFVTPPFAGYVSGHSTFSRAAAEVMTAMTGDPFFPGGMGEFIAEKDSFLVFEEGPSVNVKLQWATYRDASDQCSLSRIWGGIHPPVDDIPGRLIGEKIGVRSFNFAEKYMDTRPPEIESIVSSIDTININEIGSASYNITIIYDEPMDTSVAPNLNYPLENPLTNALSLNNTLWLNDSTHVITYNVLGTPETLYNIDIEIDDSKDKVGNNQLLYSETDFFSIDTKRPVLVNLTANIDTIRLINEGIGTFKLTFSFDEKMNTSVNPTISFPNDDPLLNSLSINTLSSLWNTDSSYIASFDVSNTLDTLINIDINTQNCSDLADNEMTTTINDNVFNINRPLIALINENSLIDVDIVVFPNPISINNNATLLISLEKGASMEIHMFDILGNKIKTILNPETRVIGEHTFEIPTSQLKSGTYYIRSKIEGKTYTKSIVIN